MAADSGAQVRGLAHDASIDKALLSIFDADENEVPFPPHVIDKDQEAHRQLVMAASRGAAFVSGLSGASDVFAGMMRVV